MSEILEKIKEKGIRQSAGLFYTKLKKKELIKAPKLAGKRLQAAEALLGEPFRRVVIFENHFGYYNIMLQRPQHLMRNMADEETLFLYNSHYDVDFHDRIRIAKLADHFYVIDLFYYRSFLQKKLREQEIDKYVIVYSTDTVRLEMVQKYEDDGYKIVYEYVDDINPNLIHKNNLENIMRRHVYLVRKQGTYVVTTATRLYENIRQMNPDANVSLICNGVQCEDFLPDVKTNDRTYLDWICENKIKVGYYGAMASWVDYDILKQLTNDTNVQLILIGVEHDNSLQDSGLLERENVKFFGKVEYKKLAGYAHFFDICIIPFVLNDITKATSPVKLFEYMSLGKPVVTTALPECKKYDVVCIADTKEQFCEEVYRAYDRKDEEKYKEKLYQCARENSWQEKARKMWRFLEG